MSDSHKRSVSKALSWRVVASMTTMIIVFAFTGEWTLSLGVGVVEVIAKMALYYGHERAWDVVRWGRK